MKINSNLAYSVCITCDTNFMSRKSLNFTQLNEAKFLSGLNDRTIVHE